MSAPISSVTSIPPIEPISIDRTSQVSGGEFQKVLQSAIQQVETSHASAESAIRGFLAGDDQELHSTILATQNAELQFDMFMQVRNKVISAYQEIMRMQV